MTTRAQKISDPDATKRYLEEGNFFMAGEAARMGLIDQVINPDAFFQEHFKGELYTIGAPKQTLWDKLGLTKNSSDDAASMLDVLVDE